MELDYSRIIVDRSRSGCVVIDDHDFANDINSLSPVESGSPPPLLSIQSFN